MLCIKKAQGLASKKLRRKPKIRNQHITKSVRNFQYEINTNIENYNARNNEELPTACTFTQTQLSAILCFNRNIRLWLTMILLFACSFVMCNNYHAVQKKCTRKSVTWSRSSNSCRSCSAITDKVSVCIAQLAVALVNLDS